MLKKIFSIEKKDVCKIITVLGCEIKIKNKRKEMQQKYQELQYKLYKYCAPERRADALKDWYYENTGKQLNLENPQTINEKIQWLKLYDSTPLKTKLADKYLVRDWVKEKIGEEYLIPLLGVWDSFDEIDFDNLPDKFVLKCNHGSGYNIIVSDKSKFDKEDARKKINNWMQEDFAFKAGFEMHYSSIPRKIIAEEYIEAMAKEQSNSEYQFYCFNGKPNLFYLANSKNINKRAVTFYDLELNVLPFNVRTGVDIAKIERTEKFDAVYKRMIEIVETLCQGFAFVRVDLCYTGDKIYFCELTFTSGSGLSKYNPVEWDRILGDRLLLQDDVGMTQ